MAYTARYLAGFAVSAVVLTGFLVGLSEVVEPLLSDRVPVRAFFFERSPIQWCTLATFLFALTVLRREGRAAPPGAGDRLAGRLR